MPQFSSVQTKEQTNWEHEAKKLEKADQGGLGSSHVTAATELGRRVCNPPPALSSLLEPQPGEGKGVAPGRPFTLRPGP